MSKLGIDDLIAAHGPEVVRELLRDTWEFDGHPCPERVHLSDIENAALGRQRLAIDLMVSAIGDTYILPKILELRCCPRFDDDESKKKPPPLRLVRDGEREPPPPVDTTAVDQPGCEHCRLPEGRWQHEVQNSDLLIDLTRTPSRQMWKRLQEYATGLCPFAWSVRVKERQTVTNFLATPKAKRLRTVPTASGLEMRDETGKPYREKVLYHQGRLDQPSRHYRAIGVAVPNPKSQEATAFLWQLQPIDEDVDSFGADPELVERFGAFQAEAGGVWTKLLAIATDITDHLTNIFGAHRRRSLLGKLLVYHSALRFRFDGELLKRGWLEMLEVGDTGQGKTQQVDRVQAATGMGEGVDGVSTTRTGLAYAYQKLNDSWFLTWGKYPLNDRGLLYVDEAQKLSPEDIDKIRKGRSDGVIAATGVRPGEHPTRTRLIMTCNPRFQGIVDDELFGVELIKQTFKDEDIRRFDFAIISSSSDEKADINERRDTSTRGEPLFPADLLRDSIRWAWSRRADDINFVDEATSEVYSVAKVLTHIYGEARDIPLVLESDVRHKVARIAVAMAALLHSSDEAHEKVLVTKEHVQAVGDFLASLYNHRNCSLDLYAKIRRAEAGLSDEEYQALWDRLRECRVSGGTTLPEDDLSTLLLAFVTHGGRISRQDLAGELGKSPEWTSKIVRTLKEEKLIRVNRGRSGGYRATPRFNKFLKLAISRRDLVP